MRPEHLDACILDHFCEPRLLGVSLHHQALLRCVGDDLDHVDHDTRIRVAQREYPQPAAPVLRCYGALAIFLYLVRVFRHSLDQTRRRLSARIVERAECVMYAAMVFVKIAEALIGNQIVLRRNVRIAFELGFERIRMRKDSAISPRCCLRSSTKHGPHVTVTPFLIMI